MQRPQVWSHGVQRAWFEPPDILWARFRGSIDPETVRWSSGVYQEVASRQRFYLAVDVTDSKHSPEARRVLVESVKPTWFLGVVYIGGTPEQRSATKTFLAGSRILSGELIDTHYVDTPDEARAWLAQHRAKRAGRPG